MKVDKIPNLEEQIAHLSQLKDEEIDFSDIPEILDWSKAVRGKFYQAPKEEISLQLDCDVIAWFKNGYENYQTKINRILRDFMVSHSQKS